MKDLAPELDSLLVVLCETIEAILEIKEGMKYVHPADLHSDALFLEIGGLIRDLRGILQILRTLDKDTYESLRRSTKPDSKKNEVE